MERKKAVCVFVYLGKYLNLPIGSVISNARGGVILRALVPALGSLARATIYFTLILIIS